MESGIQRITQEAMFDFAEKIALQTGCTTDKQNAKMPVAAPQSVQMEDNENAPIFIAPATSQPECRYVENQLKKLSRIKAILTGSEEPRSSTELEELIAECGYLYAHFPDCAAGLRMTQDFLNRIRAEVDAFLKAGQ